MPSRRFVFLSALLALVCLALPTAADPSAPLPRLSNLRSDILYTHRGEFVQVSPMRPLTLNAHVEQFAYDPLGLEIAVVGSEPQGDQTLHFVKTLDAHTGKEISRLAMTVPAADTATSFRLLGYSTSGKYVVLQRYTPDLNEPSTVVQEFVRWDLSASPAVARPVHPETALPPDVQVDSDASSGFLSPDGHWIMFLEHFHVLGSAGKSGAEQTAYLLYDTDQDTFRTLTLPEGVVASYGWSDTRHLNVRQEGDRKCFDVLTGEVSPVVIQPTADASTMSKQYPDLTLDTEYRVQEDKQPTGGHLGSYLVWIRRTPFRTEPLGAVIAGLMPSSRDTQTGPYDAGDEPQAVWSPIGKQIALISSGDVWVTDLVTATGTLPREKMAVGLKLSCAEEQELAEANLRQIGLGIAQFAQDDDEKYPNAKGLIDTLQPYLKSTDVFESDGHHFVYEKPAASLRDLESPADTGNGYIDLPCARVVLFADGHVKVFVKAMP